MTTDAQSYHTIAIISARSGSKGLPRKNLRLLAGKPLIAHTIAHALASQACDVVLVTTDDKEIANVAREYGAEVPFVRPGHLAGDLTPIEPVIQHALLTYESMYDCRFDIVVYLQTTDVFRKPEMIKTCVQGLVANPQLDSVFSAYVTHKRFWRSTDNGFERLATDIPYGPRQTNELLYREDTGIACATRAEFVRQARRIGNRVDIVPTSDFRTSIDIHTEFDLWLAERILVEWTGEKSSVPAEQ